MWARPRIARSRSSATKLTIGRTFERSGSGMLMSGLPGAFARQYRGYRLEQDLDVEGERPVLDVVEVQLEPLREWEIAPPGDLPQAGEARLQAEALALDALVEEVNVSQRHRARPDQAHLPGQHMEDLGQLVETAPAQETSHPRDPRVVGNLEDGPLGLVQVLDLRLKSIGPRHHRPELQHPEAAFVEPDPLLSEEDRTGRVQFDGHGDEANQWEQQHEHEGRNGEIHEPLDKKPPFLLGDGLEGQQRNGSKRDQSRTRSADIENVSHQTKLDSLFFAGTRDLVDVRDHRARDGQDDLVDHVFFEERGDIADCSHHGGLKNAVADTRRIWIQVSDDADTPLRMSEKRLGQPPCPGAAADDQDPAEAIPVSERPLEVPDDSESDPGQDQEIERREDQNDGATHVLDLHDEQDCEQAGQTGSHRPGDRPGIPEA